MPVRNVESNTCVGVPDNVVELGSCSSTAHWRRIAYTTEQGDTIYQINLMWTDEWLAAADDRRVVLMSCPSRYAGATDRRWWRIRPGKDHDVITTSRVQECLSIGSVETVTVATCADKRAQHWST